MSYLCNGTRSSAPKLTTPQRVPTITTGNVAITGVTCQKARSGEKLQLVRSTSKRSPGEVRAGYPTDLACSR